MKLIDRNSTGNGLPKNLASPSKKERVSKTDELFQYCPFTLEPIKGCSTRAGAAKHRCSFTLERCLN